MSFGRRPQTSSPRHVRLRQQLAALGVAGPIARPLRAHVAPLTEGVRRLAATPPSPPTPLRAQIARRLLPLSVLPTAVLGLGLSRLYADRLASAIVPLYALTAALMALGTLAALLAARGLSHRVTLELEQLAGAAAAVGRGQRGAIGNLPRLDSAEVEQLRRAVDAMVERLDGTVRQLDRRVQERTAALALAEMRTATILRTAGDALFVVDDQGRLAEVNDACCRLLGQPREALLGRRLDEIDTAQRAELEARRRRVLHHGEHRYDTTLRTAGGTEIPVEVAASALPIGAGQMLAIARDVSDRRQHARDRARLEGQLWQSQKMEAIGTLAGGIAHDFNNILTMIAGNADLAVAELGPAHPVAEKLRHITRATDRAEALVRQIVAFSRRRDPARQPVALAPIVDEAVALLRSTLPAMIDIRVHVAADLPLVDADPVQLNQVLMNLASNAAFAMREGGGTLDVRVEARRSSVADTAADGVRLVVADTGCGMDRGTVARIFEPFFTTKPDGQGSGLGLSVVHGIVTAHGGTIEVHSAPGRGTRVSIEVPAASRAVRHAALAAAPAARSAEPCGHGLRVFFVDDEPEIVDVACRHLSQLGFAITGFRLATEALAAIDAGDGCDALVTDVAMPRMSGLDLAERVRQRDASLPIVLCSGFLSDDDTARARRLDVSEVMPKPYSQKELARVLERRLTAREGEDASPRSPDPSWPGESAVRPSPSWRS